MFATYTDKVGASKALFEQARAILVNPEAPAEQKATVERMIFDAKALQTEAMQLKSIDEAHGALLAANGGLDTVAPSGFRRLGEFLHAVWQVGKGLPAHKSLRFIADKDDDGPEDLKTLSGATGAGGGFLVPPEFQTTLQGVIGEVALVRGRATVIPMRRRSVSIPVLDQTSTTAGIPHWFGGMRFYWAEEGELKTETTPSFRQMQLIARKLIGYTRSTDELLDDSAISLEAFFGSPLGFAGGVAWMEDYSFLQGTGAGQPLGVIPAPATYLQARVAAGAVGFQDLARMVEHFLPSGRGVWFITQSAMAEIIQMAGPTAYPSYIWSTNAAAGIPGTILGMPVVWTEKLPVLGAKGDVVLADWRYYLIGDRQATTIESTKFDRWQYDETSWRVVHRVDGRPWLSAPITLQDGSTQVSPFVVLDSTLS